MPLLLRSEEHTSELQSPCNLVCRLLLEKKKTQGASGLGFRLRGNLTQTCDSNWLSRRDSKFQIIVSKVSPVFLFFFFNDTATTEISPLPLPDALPIYHFRVSLSGPDPASSGPRPPPSPDPSLDRKSTRLNSSHLVISYAVFCLKK